MTVIRLPDDGLAIPREVGFGSVAHHTYVSITMLKIMNVISDGNTHLGVDVAETVGVNIRTVYRYINRLRSLGFNIKSSGGVGFRGKLPSTYALVGMHSETRLPAFMGTCKNPIEAVKQARNNHAHRLLGYHRFWAVPIYEDTNARSHGKSEQRVSQACDKHPRENRHASVQDSGHR